MSEIGGWGGGVFNGGGWLTVAGRRVDVHYRGLDDVEQQIAEAEAGRFEVERRAQAAAASAHAVLAARGPRAVDHQRQAVAGHGRA